VVNGLHLNELLILSGKGYVVGEVVVIFCLCSVSRI